MAHIRQLPSGKWRAEIERNGRRASKTTPTKREAQAWALEQEGAAKAIGAGWRTFGAACEDYVTKVSSAKSNPEWEQRRINTFVAHFGAGAPIGAITKKDIAAWRDHRLATVSGSTVNREVNLLRNIFNVAIHDWEWISANPFTGVKLPQGNEPRQSIWPWQLIKRVLRAPRTGKTREMQDAFHIALRTGMRLQEVLAAPQNYDPKRRVVTLKTKTEARAQIPIGRIAHRLLQRPAFVVEPNEGSTLFSRLCRELLIEGLTFHDARATALTHLSRKVDVMTLGKISRHKDISLLQRVYYREAADSIAMRI